MSGSIGQTYARSLDGSGAFAPGAGDDVDVAAGGDGERVQARALTATDTIAATSCAARRMWHSIALASLILVAGPHVAAHDPSSVPITWNREISRVVYDRCASCHRPDGSAFSLMTYRDAQPRADAIKASVVARRMPPWGAVKGFGDFRNDMSLTQEQISLFTDWVEVGAPRGNNPNALPQPPVFQPAIEFRTPAGSIALSGDMTLSQALTLEGILPLHAPDGAQMQIVATLPDGAIRPLLWLYEYRDKYRHPYLYRTPVPLPAGTIIRGVRSDAKLLFMPATTSWFWSLPVVRTLFGGSTR
jgi:hypothetical protein